MNMLGQKSEVSTQIYVKLPQTSNREACISKIVTSLEEAQNLIESGFEYVAEMQSRETTCSPLRKIKPWKLSQEKLET